MKIARLRDPQGVTRYGIVEGDSVWLLQQTPPGGIEEWLATGNGSLTKIADIANRLRHSVPLASVRLLAPLAHPRKFLGLGGNYQSHLEEVKHLGVQPPNGQVWFNKQTSCIAGPFDDVVVPNLSAQVDYEAELAVVIGKRCRNVPIERAFEVVGGYMICNDVSVRDIQLSSVTATLGKSFDTHGPIGPWLVTPDEIADPQKLRIRTWVNDELRQDGNTDEMRFSIAEQIVELSRIFTLEPGDILATGTPAGVAAAMRPPRWVKVGDVVKIELEGIGTIANRFIADAGDVYIQ